MLKQPTRTGKQVISDKIIRFFLHNNINYLDGAFNFIHCANNYPYSNYQAEDHLGISINEIEKSDYSSLPNHEVFNDRSIVNRVNKTPDGYNGFTITDLYFGRGWMEKE